MAQLFFPPPPESRGHIFGWDVLYQWKVKIADGIAENLWGCVIRFFKNYTVKFGLFLVIFVLSWGFRGWQTLAEILCMLSVSFWGLLAQYRLNFSVFVSVVFSLEIAHLGNLNIEKITVLKLDLPVYT
jgi:hypothetical protein